MRLWTVQRESVMLHCLETGIYQPLLSESDFVKEDEKCTDVYELVLNAFNQHNNTRCPGVVFAFARTDNKKIYDIQDYEEFQNFIVEKKPCLKSLWNQLVEKNSVVVELEVEDNFNPIYIDLNDFQFLMPPIMMLYPYTEEVFWSLLSNIKEGIITPSIFPSGVIQAHLPCIRKENVVGIYPMFQI